MIVAANACESSVRDGRGKHLALWWPKHHVKPNGPSAGDVMHIVAPELERSRAEARGSRYPSGPDWSAGSLSVDRMAVLKADTAPSLPPSGSASLWLVASEIPADRTYRW
jgi:hypothetical protein